MRHVWSLIAGVVLTPLTWLLIAFGQAEMSRGEVPSGVDDHLLIGGGLIIAVGLLLGLLGSLRTSPVGALLASLIFLGASVLMLLAPLQALDVFSRKIEVAGYDANLSSPLTSGIVAVVGGMLLMAIFSAARWRGKASAAVAEEEQYWESPVSEPRSDTDSGTDSDSEPEKIESRG